MPLKHLRSADGTSIAYRATGRGEPVLFVHGAGTSSADWLPALPLLRERFTVVTMDRRGRGQSGDGERYAIEREAEDVLAVLEDVGGELLVGHSYGARCSILAAERTDRLRALVLYEPPFGVDEGWLAEIEELLATGDTDAALELFLRGAGVPPEQLDAIRASRAWPVLLDALPTVPRELHACATWQPPATPDPVPTLILRGERTTSPRYLDGIGDLQAAFPNSRLELIPGQRHVGHVFAAETFAALVGDFLAGEQAGASAARLPG